ncbi:hypothetical protein SPRG_07023 [Saprolegnia parasitica CBS 223.65]|uniref:WW domain-containing protein n=1 Tax=Saprolegnia parasitica (strain CBS 223.65) TaxID=695850 RepID=A0A067CE24_SAPPC|nr:hypothetical protein SPRG_07023 [Saprolegnia parasitica CBS 223.65]KDO27435.1 hypothetical protein SPRG_07023 [Saprolegnia parasitica CBS 223.65]|eukprot:XP_012201874.1 hypothetical protein SPRG_07023 [Saprolegnia parasitica CBS 223.65]
MASPDRPIELVEDLLGALLFLLAVVYAVALELTRRRVVSLSQLAFALAATIGVGVVGGALEHQLSNEMLDLALFGSYTQTYVAFKVAPIACAVGMTVGVAIYLSLCSCACCCDAPEMEHASHESCILRRLRQSTSVYLVSAPALYVVIGMRLNARIRLSAIKPVGGTLHWQALQCPLVLSTVHMGSLLLILLKRMLDHAAPSSDAPAMADTVVSTPVGKKATPRPSLSPRHRAPAKEAKSSPAKPGVSSAKMHNSVVHALTVATTAPSPAKVPEPSGRVSPKIRPKLTLPDAIVGVRAKAKPAITSPRKDDSESRPRARSALPSPATSVESDASFSRPLGKAHSDHERPRMVARRRRSGPRDDGNMSGLISSESETDEDMLVPSSSRQFTSEFAIDHNLATPLHDDRWVLCYDEATGAGYYYCHETGESRWEKPKWE